MSQPRKHHFVQAEHIRRFMNTDGTVWVYSKDGKNFGMTPEAIFKQKDLNSYETPDGLDTSFEAYVTAIENHTFPAIARTIEAGRLSGGDVLRATAYLALSKIRNPTLQSGVVEHHRQSVRTAARLSERQGKFADLGELPGYPGKSLSELIDDGIIKIDINNSVYLSRIADMMKSTHNVLYRGFSWSLVVSHRGRVLISDHPLTVVHPGLEFGLQGIPMGGDGCEVAFPLSKNLYLVGLWGQHALGDIESEDAVDELNKRQAIFASRHLAASEPRSRLGSLATRYRHHGFQTRADTLDVGSGAYQIIAGGVFLLARNSTFRGAHPLKSTLPLRSFIR